MGLDVFLDNVLDRLRDRRPVTVKVGEHDYAVKIDGTIGDAVRPPGPQYIKPTFAVSSLAALVALCEAKVDEFDKGATALHVVDHLTVQLVSLKADECGHRHVYAAAKHVEETRFKFNAYTEAEDFIIAFRSSFLFNENAVMIQQLVSNLSSGQSVNVADDGVSQQLEIKAGVTGKQGVVIPSEGIELIPWRTFRDASPVTSRFLLRLRSVKDGLPQIALFDIDQKWKIDTVHSIATWLSARVKDATVIA